VLLVVLAAAGVGVWFGRREATAAQHPKLSLHPTKTLPTQATRHSGSRPEHPQPPPRLLYGTPLLAGAHVHEDRGRRAHADVSAGRDPRGRR